MIDSVRLDIKGGDGGNGCISFLREKYRPHGGPNGGDGGNGGDAYIQGDSSFNTLLHLKFTSTIYVPRGRHGGGKTRRGGNGEDLVIRVPYGTEVWLRQKDEPSVLLADIPDDRKVLVARGGQGGWGNTRFVSATNQEPVLAQSGEAGERVILDLELKLLADVGILARPNAGKSTLISRCSAAKPKVADYPFTTVEPILGVVSIHNKDFVMMEIPGLLEGAHLGVGLGYRFLKHAERAKMYLYLVDGLAEDPVGDLQMVNHELMQFSPELAAKPQIIAVNKLDVTEVKENRGELERALIELKGGPQVQGLRDAPIFFISAVSGEGVTELLGKIVEVLGNVPVAEPDDLLEAPVPVSRRRPRTASSVSVEKGVYVVQSEELERLVTMSDTRDRRVLLQLWREMGRLGVAVQLEEAGVEAGDTIRIGDAEVEWF